MPYRTVLDTEPSNRALLNAFTDPRPTVPSEPCRHKLRRVVVCMQRTIEITVFIYYWESSMVLTIYGSEKLYETRYSFVDADPTWLWLFTELGLSRVPRYSFSNADPTWRGLFGSEYGSGLPTDHDRIRTRRYTSRNVFYTVPSIVRNITVEYINKRFYVRSVFIFLKKLHNWEAVYMTVQITVPYA